MNIKNWFNDIYNSDKKKALPILSFPSIQLLDVTVRELISDSTLQAKGMKAVAERCDMAAAVGMMDLSVEAEAFGATAKTDDNEVPTIIGSIIKTMDDAKNLTVPNVYEKRTNLYIESIKAAKASITDRPVFAGIIGPFSLAGRLMDMTEIMVNCYIDPQMVKETLKKTTEFLIGYAQAFKKAGADGVIMAEPAAGLLSPKLIDDFSSAYVRQIVAEVKTDDFGFIYHNCGNTIPLIDSILTIGAHAYHFGNAIDIEEMLSLVPSDTIIMGNIDPAGQFRNGTPESIYEETTKRLTKLTSHKNFVISSGCDIPPLASWDNIDSFFKAVSDFYN